LNELREGLDQASDASIFFHTFQSLGRHHFLTEGFSNELAQWVLTGLNRPQLAERLGGLGVRDYLSLAELPGDLRRIVTEYCQEHPREADISVAEALWKKKPVVASAVGGIPVRVMHKQTGLLAHSVEGTAYQIRFLLSHPEIAARLGEQGHAHVREEFLITGKVKRYITLFLLTLWAG
jgi:glycosyltransferase involved in cell wall biosynthesis